MNSPPENADVNMDDMDTDYLNYPILISGASSGIGFACAQLLAQSGARHLILTAREMNTLASAREQLQSTTNRRVDAFVCDHSQRDDIDKLLSQLELNGWPGAFIANVGVNPVHQTGAKKIHNTPYELCQQIVATNITHTFYLASALLRDMRRQRFGRIVLIGSQAYRHGIPGQALYNISKSSLVGLKNSVVGEYAGNNIFCHLLNPGIVLNQRTAKLRQHDRLQQDSAVQTARIVTEEDVATAVQGLLAIDDPAGNGQEIDI